MSTFKQEKTLAGEIALVFEYTYPRDGFDPIAGTINGKDPKKDKAVPDYAVISDLTKNTYQARTAVIQILTFFGIPNRVTRPNYKDGSLKPLQIVKNLFGWHDADSPIYQKVLNYTLIKPVLTLVFNVLTIVAKTSFNIVKLVTEFVPSLISKLLETGAIKLNATKKDNAPLSVKNVAITAGFSVLKGMQYLFKAIHLLGRTITSPVTSIRAGLAYGDKWYEKREKDIMARKYSNISEHKRVLARPVNNNEADQEEIEILKKQTERREKDLKSAKQISIGIKTGLTILSAATTAAFYVVLFPIALKMLALKVPVAASTAGEFIVKAVNWLDKVPYVSNAVNGILTGAKALLGPVLKTVGVEVSSTIMTVASTTLAVVSVASIAENVKKRVANAWYGSTKGTFKLTPSSVSLGNVNIAIGKSGQQALDSSRQVQTEIIKSSNEGRGFLNSLHQRFLREGTGNLSGGQRSQYVNTAVPSL